MMGTSSVTASSPTEWVSFHGLPIKDAGVLPSQYRYLDELRSHKLIPESMSLAGRNALMKLCNFLMEHGGYTFGQALVLASAIAALARRGGPTATLRAWRRRRKRRGLLPSKSYD